MDMENKEKQNIELPENAFRELKEGEEYQPVMSPNKVYPEVSTWSVTWGLVMVVLFSAAAAYLGLKVGQVFEAAIPIAIIAIGMSSATKRKNALGENVIIQSIGACSGAVVAGGIFVMPAIYMLELQADFFQIFIAAALGGILGILFLIPFRKYFVKEQHGKYPFPEATATTQVLVSGEKGGSQAKPLLLAGLVGGLYDFSVATFGWWNETVTSRMIGFGETIADKAKLVFKVNTGAAILGLGYIIGLKYAFIICMGSLAVWWLIVPGMALLFPDTVLNQWDPSVVVTVGSMSAEEIFKNYARSIGIGGIAMSGVIGIVKSWGIIKSAVSLASREMKGKGADQEEAIRTQRDISFKIIAFGSITTLVITFLFFYFGVMQFNLMHAVVGIVLVALIAFLFTTVAANAIAIVGSNPVSGMTLMTLILASVVMVAVGLKGNSGMLAALLMGGVVCTALSMAGSFITDLKIGYWLGTTPKKQETWKFLGTIVSAATVAGVMIVLDKTYGIGAVLALVLDRCKVPALAFSLGMFIPIQLNIPLIIGGAVNWYVTTRSKDEQINKLRGDKGTLIASGFIAGGALMGVVSALIKFFGIEFDHAEWWQNHLSELLALVAYIALILYFITATKVSGKDKAA